MSKNLFLTLDKPKLLVTHKKPSKNIEKLQNLTNGSKNTMKATDVNEVTEVISIHDSTESDVILEEEAEDEETEDDESSSTCIVISENDERLIKENSVSNRHGSKRKRDEMNIGKNIKFGNDVVKNFATSDSITGPLPVLPGVSSFFNPHNEEADKTSSDEEEQVLYSNKILILSITNFFNVR